MGVGLHPATLVRLNAGFIQRQPGSEGITADRQQHDIGVDGFGLAALGGLHGQRHAGVGDGRAGHLMAELEGEALLHEHLLEGGGDFIVQARRDAVEELDNGDLRAEAVPHAAQLQPDHPCADDDQMLRHLVQLQRAGGGDDALLIDLNTL